MAQVLAEREAERKQEAIQDEIMLARRRAEADADYYRCVIHPQRTFTDCRVCSALLL